MPTDKSTFAQRLRRLREQHNPPLNQKGAAKLIGMSLRHYGRLERGQADASIATIREIARAYKIDPTLLTVNGNERLTATGQAPTLADFARLEAKIDTLLDHFELGTDEPLAMPDELAKILTASQPQHQRRRRG